MLDLLLMKKDRYGWVKQRIIDLVGEVDSIKSDDREVSPGQIWSIKKLLALDYYIQSAYPIFKKYFNEYFYVDTHCGTGVIDFKDHPILCPEIFPGSPLISVLNTKCQFSKYLLSDSSDKSISALKDRLKQLEPRVRCRDCEPSVTEFADVVQNIKTLEKPGRAFLIFVDPTGYKELEWQYVRKLLSIKRADIFITFMGYSFALNSPHAKPNTKSEKTLDSVFGNSNWKKCHGQKELLDLYLRQIKEFKEYVEVIPVYKTGESKLYDIIFATGNAGAALNIINYIKDMMKNITTEIIEDALKAATKKTTDLDKWF